MTRFTQWRDLPSHGRYRAGQMVRVAVYDPARDRDETEVVRIIGFRTDGATVRVVVRDDDGVTFRVGADQIIG